LSGGKKKRKPSVVHGRKLPKGSARSTKKKKKKRGGKGSGRRGGFVEQKREGEVMGVSGVEFR